MLPRPLAILIAAAALATFGAAQTPSAVIAAPEGDVIGVGNFLHIVANLEKSLEFYHDILGMDLQPGPGGQPPPSPRPLLSTPEIVNLYNATGGQYRVGNTQVVGNPMRQELIEWNGVERKPIRPRIQDPGASILKLTVRNLDPIVARVKKSGASIVSSGSEPVQLNEHSRAILLRDPDGFFVELIQTTPEPATRVPAESNFIDVSFAFVVSDSNAMTTVFRDGLGFQPQTGSFGNEGLALFGLGRAQYRMTKALVPGSSFEVEWIEFKGVDHAAIHSRPQDPGTALLRLRVQNMDSGVKALGAVGVKIVSTGGNPVTLPGGAQRAAITSAPDNLFIQALQAAPAR